MTESGRRERLLIATTNPGKLREIREALAGLPFDVFGPDALPPGPVPAERGRTFLENARAKSLYYSRRWDGLTLADDSGLEVDALGGLPGVRSARFAPPRPTDERNNRRLLRLMADAPPECRGARFVCAMVLTRAGEIVREIRGEVRGRIAVEPRGGHGFGYDPLFYYPPLRKTFAELTAAEKNRVSHRGRALRRLRAHLLKMPHNPGPGGAPGQGRRSSPA